MTSKTVETFGARLARLRSAAGLSAYALGKLSGVDQGHVRRLERGEQQPSLETARKLAEALGQGLQVWQ